MLSHYVQGKGIEYSKQRKYYVQRHEVARPDEILVVRTSDICWWEVLRSR